MAGRNILEIRLILFLSHINKAVSRSKLPMDHLVNKDSNTLSLYEQHHQLLEYVGCFPLFSALQKAHCIFLGKSVIKRKSSFPLSPFLAESRFQSARLGKMSKTAAAFFR